MSKTKKKRMKKSNTISDRYTMVENANADFIGIRICDGSKYDGLIYHYRHCSLSPEPNNNQARVQFAYDIVKKPKKCLEEDLHSEEFITLLGDILVDLLVKTMEKDEGFLLTENLEKRKERFEKNQAELEKRL